MNKQHAQAWDEIAELADTHDARLVRDGHRFTYQWDTRAGLVQVWATENQPVYGLRVGEVSARCWNLDSLTVLLAALT